MSLEGIKLTNVLNTIPTFTTFLNKLKKQSILSNQGQSRLRIIKIKYDTFAVPAILKCDQHLPEKKKEIIFMMQQFSSKIFIAKL